MVGALLGTIVVGMVLGLMFLDVTAKPMLDDTLMAALDFMGFVAGIEIGSNRRLLKQICTPKNLALALALPTGVVIGSLGGAYLSHFLTAFLANMLREVSSFVLIPLLARWNKLMCIAPGGAGTMDSLLPLVIRGAGMQAGMFAFINGLILSLLVPVLLSVLLE